MLVGGGPVTVSTGERSIPFQYGVWGVESGTKVIVVHTALKVFCIAGAPVASLAV